MSMIHDQNAHCKAWGARAPLMQETLHLGPQRMPGHAGHDRIVEALIAAVLQLQHHVKAVQHRVHRIKALHVHVQVQTTKCMQQERPQRVSCTCPTS